MAECGVLIFGFELLLLLRVTGGICRVGLTPTGAVWANSECASGEVGPPGECDEYPEPAESGGVGVAIGLKIKAKVGQKSATSL